MKKHCKFCEKNISKKVIIYDDYYFCSVRCRDSFIRGQNNQNKKIIVLAGSRIEFEDYIDDKGLTDTEAIYGYGVDRIRGIEASKVEVIGTFWDRKDAGDLKREADTRVR